MASIPEETPLVAAKAVAMEEAAAEEAPQHKPFRLGIVMGAIALAGVTVGAVVSYAKPTAAVVSTSNMMAQESCKKTPQTEQGYYTCPAGNYLGHTAADQEERNARLRNLHEKLRDMGYAHNERETSNSYKTRGFATYESSMWLKPTECQTLPDEEWSAENKGYLEYKEDNSPEYITKMVNDEYKMEFHLNWKVASTSFPSYLWCEYGTWEDVSKETAVSNGYEVVAAVRHPLSRFVSSVGELMQRSVNHYCPTGYCTFETDYWQGNITLEKFAHQTTWYNLLKDGINMTQLPEIMAAFVADTKCNYYTYASEHFITQSDFVTQNGGCAAPVNNIIQLEKLDSGLSELAKTLGHTESGSCSLEDSNEASDKPGGVPTSGEMLKVLTDSPELLKEICYMYAQDFICFDYDLPEACDGLF